MMRAAAFGCLLLMSCSTSSSHEHISFAQLNFDLPSDWQKVDSSRRGVASATWTPEENTAKESITVIRTELAPTLAHADEAALARLLEQAQSALPEVHASEAKPVRTASGLSGMRVEVDFVPPGHSSRYHRTHVALLDGASVIHVFYTALDEEHRSAALDTVLASIREEG